MYGGDRDQDTICAVSTPYGVGGISVIRVSGSRALTIVRKIGVFLPESPESHKAYFGLLKTPENHEPIDEVLATYFKHGKSFTGEEVIEISCHGSPHLCQNIMNILVLMGARPADRGEFTYRAFMNGNMDLVQAESVLALIESQTQQSSRLALRQLKGDLSSQLESVENDLTWILARAEVGIDFSTEDIQVVDQSEVLLRLNRTAVLLEDLISSFKVGRILKDGFKVVLAGLPNVGKSSLLNVFLEDQRAIVTDIAGTTRDVIHGDTTYDGFKFTFLDTAGLRSDASDLVEKIGIERSYEAQSDADLILFVFDAEKGFSTEELTILDTLEPLKVLVIFNKIDRVSKSFGMKEVGQALWESKFFQKLSLSGLPLERRFFFVSAIDKKTRALVLKELVRDFVHLKTENSVLLSNARHFENLSRAAENVRAAKSLVHNGAGDEFLAIELKEALIVVHETLGKRFDDQVMDRVFREFCIGK